MDAVELRNGQRASTTARLHRYRHPQNPELLGRPALHTRKTQTFRGRRTLTEETRYSFMNTRSARK